MGGFVLLVGPSGAGKDTLLRLAREQLAGDSRFLFVKRIVTRPNSAAEEHETLDAPGFDAAEREGRFALSWRAHGLAYGIPAAALEAVRQGRIAVCNASRKAVATARETLPEVSVVEVTAPSEILLARIAQRGRSEDGDIEARVRRSDEVSGMVPDLRIENTGSPEQGAAELVRFLEGRAVRSGADLHA